MAEAHGATKTCDNLGRSWRVSWVCGEGRVDRIGPYDESLGQVLLGGCDLSILYDERHLWWVHVSGVDPRMSRRGEPSGRRYHRGMGCRLTPLEKMSYLVLPKDWYVERIGS